MVNSSRNYLKQLSVFENQYLWLRNTRRIYFPFLLHKKTVVLYHENMQYVRITKILYKHNKVNGIKKNPQNDPKVLRLSNLDIIWTFVL